MGFLDVLKGLFGKTNQSEPEAAEIVCCTEGTIETHFNSISHSSMMSLPDTRMTIHLRDKSVVDLDSSNRQSVSVTWDETGWQLHISLPISPEEKATLRKMAESYERNNLTYWHEPVIEGDNARIPLEVKTLIVGDKEYRYWYDIPSRYLATFKAEVYPDRENADKVLAWLLQGKAIAKE